MNGTTALEKMDIDIAMDDVMDIAQSAWDIVLINPD